MDLMRFLAALAVVLYHYTYRGFAADNLSPVSYPAIDGVTRYGYLGVELFFLISGYVVLLSAYGKTVKQFFLSRVTRLYPAFWAACTATFVFVRLLGPRLAPTDAHYSPYLVVYFKQYAVNMTMLFDYFGYLNLDTAYWSLTYEISFYFLITLLISYNLLTNIPPVIAGWLLLTLGCYLVLGSGSHAPVTYLFIPRYSPYFAAGMLFYLLQHRMAPAGRLYALLLGAWVLALYTAHHEMKALNQIFHNPNAYSYAVVASITTGFFLLFWLMIQRVFVLAPSPWLVLLGSLTYPLYLIHSNIGYVAYQRLAPFVGRWPLLLLLVGSMLGLAYLIHVLVERKLSKVLKQVVQELLLRLTPAPPPQQYTDRFELEKEKATSLSNPIG
ncbi:hypothetical protein A8B98_08660 [Hymenobacter sp. UV11]|nr:hypothetical protein A8B98_08660 [Hymenobacter sp. UV11]